MNAPSRSDIIHAMWRAVSSDDAGERDSWRRVLAALPLDDGANANAAYATEDLGAVEVTMSYVTATRHRHAAPPSSCAHDDGEVAAEVNGGRRRIRMRAMTTARLLSRAGRVGCASPSRTGACHTTGRTMASRAARHPPHPPERERRV